MRDGNTLRPAIGALLIALGHSTRTELRVPSVEIIDLVKGQVADTAFKWRGVLQNA